MTQRVIEIPEKVLIYINKIKRKIGALKWRLNWMFNKKKILNEALLRLKNPPSAK